jgi:hypothetical protein
LGSLNIPLKDVKDNSLKLGARTFLVAYAIGELLKVNNLFLKVRTERFRTLFKATLESLKKREVLTYRTTEKKGKLVKHKVISIEPTKKEFKFLTNLVTEFDDKTINAILFDWSDIEVEPGKEEKVTIVNKDKLRKNYFKEKEKALRELSDHYIEVGEKESEMEEKIVSLIESI